MPQDNIITSVNQLCEQVNQWCNQLELKPQWKQLWQSSQQAQAFRLDLSSCSFKTHQALDEFQQKRAEVANTYGEDFLDGTTFTGAET